MNKTDNNESFIPFEFLSERQTDFKNKEEYEKFLHIKLKQKIKKLEEKVKVQDARIFSLEGQVADIMYGRSEQLVKMQNVRTETLENDILILKKMVTEHIM
jgi:hypothetical protein